MPQSKEPSAARPTGAASPPPAPAARADSQKMLPPRERRRNPFERIFVRLVATAGVVAIGVPIAAIMGSSNTASWIIGLVVAIVSVVLAAILWSSRQL